MFRAHTNAVDLPKGQINPFHCLSFTNFLKFRNRNQQLKESKWELEENHFLD